MMEVLKLVGAVLGILAFVWRLSDAWRGYLQIALDRPQLEEGLLLVKVSVENRSPWHKSLDNATLLICPESEDPIDAAQYFAERAGRPRVGSTNDIAAMRCDEAIVDDCGRAFVPLPFFYSENIAIADEKVTYRACVRLRGLEPGSAYAVRLFVRGAWRLHRTSEETFVAPSIGARSS